MNEIEFKKLIEALSKYPIEVLNLSDECLTQGQCKELIETLKKNKDASKLKKIDLDGIKFENDEFAIALTEALVSIHSLRTLNLGGIRFKTVEATLKLVTDVLAKNTHLKRVGLRNIGIDDKNAAELATVLKNTRLKSIDLGYNKIGDVALTQLAGPLLDNDGLINLNLEMNEIGNAGATELAKALLRNTSLRCLDIRDNNIDEGMLEFKPVLEKHISLQEFRVMGNRNEDDKMHEIELGDPSSFKRNTSLLTFDFSKNNVNFARNRALLQQWRLHASGIGMVVACARVDTTLRIPAEQECMRDPHPPASSQRPNPAPASVSRLSGESKKEAEVVMKAPTLTSTILRLIPFIQAMAGFREIPQKIIDQQFCDTAIVKEQPITKWTARIRQLNDAIIKFEQGLKNFEGGTAQTNELYEIYSSVDLKQDNEIQRIVLKPRTLVKKDTHGWQPFYLTLYIVFKNAKSKAFNDFWNTFLHFAHVAGHRTIAIDISFHRKTRLQSIFFKLIENYNIPKEIIDALWESSAFYRRYSPLEKEFYKDPLNNENISNAISILSPTTPTPDEVNVAAGAVVQRLFLESKSEEENKKLSMLIAIALDKTYLTRWFVNHHLAPHGMTPPHILTETQRQQILEAIYPEFKIPYFEAFSEATFSLAEAYFENNDFEAAKEVLEYIDLKDAFFPQAQLMKAKIQFSECYRGREPARIKERELIFEFQCIKHPEIERLSDRLLEIHFGYPIQDIKSHMNRIKKQGVLGPLETMRSSQEMMVDVLNTLDKVFRKKGPLKYTQSMFLQVRELFPKRDYRVANHSTKPLYLPSHNAKVRR